MLNSIRFGSMLQALNYVGLQVFVRLVFHTAGSVTFKRLRKYTDDMVVSRLKMGKDRNDLFEGLVKKQAEWASDLKRTTPVESIHRADFV